MKNMCKPIYVSGYQIFIVKKKWFANYTNEI